MTTLSTWICNDGPGWQAVAHEPVDQLKQEPVSSPYFSPDIPTCGRVMSSVACFAHRGKNTLIVFPGPCPLHRTISPPDFLMKLNIDAGMAAGLPGEGPTLCKVLTSRTLTDVERMALLFVNDSNT